MPASNIEHIIEYIWIPILGGLLAVWRKMSGLDTRAQLLEKAETNFETQRLEDNKRSDRDRNEVFTRIDSHHKIVMTKLDNLELRIKNGN